MNWCFMRTLIVFIFLFFIADAYCQDIDKNQLRTVVKALSADSMEGRFPGTAGIERAATYIERSFRAAGVTNVSRQEFNLQEKGWGEVYLSAGGKKFYNPDDFILHSSDHINEEVEKELVFAGRGTPDELNAVNVKDRVVLVFVSNLRSWYEIANALRQRKAFALLIANPDKPAQFSSIQRNFKDYVTARRLFLEDGKLSRSIPLLDTLRTLPTFSIKNELVTILMRSSIKTLLRCTDNKTLANVAETRIGLKAEFTTRTTRTANVVARVPGLIDSTIVISAHYDHLGKSGNETFHGADDNASGTAGIIALAKIYSQPETFKYSMTFLATTGEEEGLLGSTYHVTTTDFDPKKVIFNLNLDMIGHTDPKHSSREPYVYLVGASQPIPMKELFEKAARTNGLTLDFSESGSTGMYQRSDQFSFHARGIPAVQMFSGLHDNYHTLKDTHDLINYPLLSRRVAFAQTFIRLMHER